MHNLYHQPYVRIHIQNPTEDIGFLNQVNIVLAKRLEKLYYTCWNSYAFFYNKV